MKIQTAAAVLSILLASVFTSPQIFASTNDHTSMTVENDRSNYMQGETVRIHGTVAPFKESASVSIQVLDPYDNTYLVADVLPEAGEDNTGIYSYQIKLDESVPAGIWTVNAKHAGQYTLYDRASTSFRVSEDIDILAWPFLQVSVDGTVDTSSGEWAHGYDTKYWKPFTHKPGDVEGNISFNAYYVNGILYAVFDIPDRKFDAKDFVEVGVDLASVAEDFSVGDDVYIFRVFRDGTSESFKLGTEYFPEEKSDSRLFTARAEEGGDIRVQVFDNEGRLLNVMDSLRDTTSTSFKGMLGIAGLEVDRDGSIYALDSDSGIVSKYRADGALLGSFGERGSDLKQFLDPTGIALDSEGNLYVADTGNARVQKFDAGGKFLSAFGSMGIDSVGVIDIPSPESEGYRIYDSFESPEAIAVGPSGEVYIADRRSGSVSVFDADGNFVESFGMLVVPTGIAADAGGDIYVVEQGNNRIMKFDSSGVLQDKFGAFGNENGMFKSPHGVAVDADGYLYVADSINHRVQKFTGDGTFVATWGSKGTGNGEFIGPHGIAVDSASDIYVVDTGNKRVQKFDADGQFLNAFGSAGTEAGKFASPEGIAIDSSGNIYVTDPSNKMIQKFSNSGVFLAALGAGSNSDSMPFGIAVDGSDNLYVTEPFAKVVQKIDAGGNLILRWGSVDAKEPLSADELPRNGGYVALDNYSHAPIGVVDAKIVEEQGKGAYFVESGKTWKILHIFRDTIYVSQVDYAKDAMLAWAPDGIDIDSYGNVYIVDRENEVAKKFSNNGELLLKWGKTGSGDGEFAKPTAMARDSQNNLYIVDTGNNRVQKFDSNGKFLAKWGDRGNGPGQFDAPRGIAVDSENNVYVLDNGNSRVQKFDSDGNYIAQWGSEGSSAGQFDNLSTEGIAVDSEGRVYVADLPGEAKATHWIAEIAVPLYLKDDAFGIYMAQGSYGGRTAEELGLPSRVKIVDVYRNAWPEGAVPALPGTWAKAKITDLDEVRVEPSVSIETVRACEDGDCIEVTDASTVPAGTRLVVTASAELDQVPAKFGYDRVSMTLQYSLDGTEWMDADTANALISGGQPATASLKWMPLETGPVSLRVTASGVLAKEASSDPVRLEVLESDAYSIRADLGWAQDRIVQGEQASFELTFGGAVSLPLEEIDYEVRIMKDDRIIADTVQAVQTEDGKTVFRHKFMESGAHTVQVRILGVEGENGLISTSKTFNYRIDVLPVEQPVQVTSIQRGEAIKVVIRNSEVSSVEVDKIMLSLANVARVEFRLPAGWSAIVNTEDESVEFRADADTLKPGEAMAFVLKSKSLSESLYNICWNLEQSSLDLKLC